MICLWSCLELALNASLITWALFRLITLNYSSIDLLNFTTFFFLYNLIKKELLTYLIYYKVIKEVYKIHSFPIFLFWCSKALLLCRDMNALSQNSFLCFKWSNTGLNSRLVCIQSFVSKASVIALFACVYSFRAFKMFLMCRKNLRTLF